MLKPPDSIRLVPKYADDSHAILLEEEYRWEQLPDTGEGLVQWTLPGHDVKISWLYDPRVSKQYFIIEGSDRQHIADQIESRLDILHPKDFRVYLKELYEGEHPRQSLLNIAAAAPDTYDEETFQIIQEGLQNTDRFTRSFAAIAAHIIGWKEFIEPVKQLRTDDDRDVRLDAEHSLSMLYKINNMPVPEKPHIKEGLTQLDMPKDIVQQLHLKLEDWADSIPIRGAETVYIYDQLPSTDATEEEIYARATELSDARTKAINAMPKPFKEGGVYCPICHISSIDADILGKPCPKCNRKLLRFNWTTF